MIALLALAACPKGGEREPAAVPTEVRIDWPDAAVIPGASPDAGVEPAPADAGVPDAGTVDAIPST